VHGSQDLVYEEDVMPPPHPKEGEVLVNVYATGVTRNEIVWIWYNPDISLPVILGLKYLHYFGNESNESLLEAYGIISSGQQIDQLRPKQCPNCSEPNKIDSRFCLKCRMVLTYDAYNETLEQQKKKESEVEVMKVKHEEDMKSMRDEMHMQFEKIMSVIQQNPQLAQVKPEALTKKLDK
jgi:hypothetical protein